MIVTLTLNTAIDRTLFVKEFAWNKTIRATQSALGMGGKATDASWILGELGYANLAMGFAAGDVGRQMEKMLRQRGCRTDFVWVKGETRTNIVVISEKGKGQTTLTSGGLIITWKDYQLLKRKFQSAIRRAQCVVIGGSIPSELGPEIYTELINMVKQARVPVVFDASGPGLKAGLQSKPDFAKPNIDEIAELSGKRVTSLRNVYMEAKKLQQEHGTSFVITLGDAGALAVLNDKAYQIPPLKLNSVSTAGAGDGVLAGISVALALGKPIEDGLRLGFAAAAAVCLTPATADCRREDVERLLPRIRLIPYKVG